MEIELDLLGTCIGKDEALTILSYSLSDDSDIKGIGELWYSKASYFTEGII